MKKTSLLFFAMLLISMFTYAQTIDSPKSKNNPTDYPVWIDMMMDQDANFYETVDAFNKYWENRTYRKGQGYNPFKRWEWHMQFKINPDGSRKIPGYDRSEYLKYRNNHNTDSRFSGNWTNLGPIHLPSSNEPSWGNGRINAIAFHPTDADLFYAGAPSGGLWRTNDGGQTWTPLSDNQPSLGVSSIVVDYNNPDIIYVGTGDRDGGDAEGLGVYKSTDGGANFFPSNDNISTATVGRLIQSPVDANVLYAATSFGIYKTTDGAASWVRKYSGIMQEIVFKPNDPNVIYASASGKFFKSINAGDNWIRITSGISGSPYRGVIDVSIDNPNYVYFFTTTYSAYNGLYLSTDAGENFTLQSDSPNVMGWACNGGEGGQAWYDLDIGVDPNDANVIYAGGINCWKSNDAGQSWVMVSHMLGQCDAESAHADLHVLEWNPLNNILYVGNDGGVWWTDDDGDTWNNITDGLAIGQQYKLSQSKLLQNHVATGYQDNGISFYHTDSWIQSDMFADGMECVMDIQDTSLAYGCAQFGRMYRMIDDKATTMIAGNNINGINEMGNWVTPFCQHENNPEVMFIGYQNLWRTTDLQEYNPDWTRISLNIGGGALRVVEHSPADENLLYFAANSSLVRSDNIMDEIPDYIILSSSLPGSGSVFDIEAHPINPEIVYVTRGAHVYKSTNKGFSWDDISGSLPDVSINDIAFYNRNNIEGLYIGTNIGVFFKDEYMTDWVLFSDGLPAAILVTEIEIYNDPDNPLNDRIRASSYGRGLWGSLPHYYTPEANFEANETIIPSDCVIDFFDLSQGYPHSWSWTFEGGMPATSNLQNPEGIVYENEGTYAVTLSVTNPDGSDTKTISAYINVIEGMLPIVNFYSEDTVQCSNASIQLFDESGGCSNQWLWSFIPDNVTYLEGTTETSQNPIVSISDPGLYSVNLTVSNNSGSNVLNKENYLFIGGRTNPYYEDFTGNSFQAMGCQIENPDYNNTWELIETQTAYGLKQVSWINNYGYNTLNAKDYLILPILNFQSFDNVFMTFDYAYAQRYSRNDSLIVNVSVDCGESWERVYANGPDGQGSFATSEPTSEPFLPQDGNDWCGAGYGADCPIIDLSQWAGNTDIKVRFESITRFGNNLYISNVEISNTVGVIDDQFNNNDIFLIYPNPAKGQINILVNYKDDYLMQLMDAQGRVLISKEMNQNKSEIDINDLKQGVYFIRITTKGFSATQKLIVY